MATSIGVKASINAGALKAISQLARDQIPYATAVALTSVAQMTQKRIQVQLPHEFKIRRPWTVGGIRYQMAKKRDWPNASAKVGSIDPYMVDFEAGGPHKTEGSRTTGAKTGEHTTAFVLPLQIRKALGITDMQVIPRADWPGRLLSGKKRIGRKGGRSKPLPFLQTMPSGKTGIFIRDGQFYDTPGKKAGKTRRREKFTMLWELRKKPSKVPRKKWLTATATAMMSGHLGEEFEKAIKTAK